jgi:shikimate kinase
MSAPADPTARPRGRHIVLVGLPGAGKSTVGRLLAQALACPWLDLDAEIERRQGLTVSQIFQREGEDAFRDLERMLTLELAGEPGMVITPGGGWMSREGNVAALRPPARLIHLAVSVDTAVARLGDQVSRRPLLAGPDPITRLATLAVSRIPLYGMADAEIDTQNLTPQEVAEKAVRLATRWGWRIG